jgi:hypothetical protein
MCATKRTKKLQNQSSGSPPNQYTKMRKDVWTYCSTKDLRFGLVFDLNLKDRVIFGLVYWVYQFFLIAYIPTFIFNFFFDGSSSLLFYFVSPQNTINLLIFKTIISHFLNHPNKSKPNNLKLSIGMGINCS